MRGHAPTALALAVAAALPAGAGAVHQTHHSNVFEGRTSEGGRVVLRVLSHRHVGLRVRCGNEATRFRNVPVGREGRFSRRRPDGIAMRGKIGWDAEGRPAFPEPFSFANNEARGRVRCGAGPVTWRASR